MPSRASNVIGAFCPIAPCRALLIAVPALSLHLLPSIFKVDEQVLIEAKRPLKASMNALSVGLPGREKSSTTPLVWAHRSRSRETNSVPWSTRIIVG